MGWVWVVFIQFITKNHICPLVLDFIHGLVERALDLGLGLEILDAVENDLAFPHLEMELHHGLCSHL